MRRQKLWWSHLRIFLFCLSLTACSNDDPITFGFVGGLSGPVSDLGGPSRNGMLLAIEAANANGGIDGRRIHTIIRDDKQDPERAQEVVRELLKRKVDVIIGPMTSAMAMAVIDQVNAAQTLMMGVTVTTDQLSGIDDYFMRCLASTGIHSAKVAEYLYTQKEYRSFSALVDTSNASYTQSWITNFSNHFRSLGGKEDQVLSFHSGDQNAMVEVASQLSQSGSDIVLLVSNALDAAVMAKLLRTENSNINLAVAEWAGTERLVELGGRHVEGTVVPQYIDRESTKPGFLEYRDTYQARFSHTPGFPSMIAYDATNIVLSALKQNPDPSKLKETILAIRHFKGLSGPITFDDYGDGSGLTFITEIKNGRYRVQASQ